MPVKKRIAIVDDTETFCTLVKLNLECSGRFEVAIVTDPRETAKMARTFKPDLILLDMMMPNMDGTEVAAQLKQIPETASIPIIFLTAIADAQAGEELKISGQSTLNKPVTISELVHRIDQTIR